MTSWDPAALECLAAIVEEGGFERAAQKLHITQSAVSQRLRALESQVGSVLVERTRPVKPTSAGRLLLKHAKQLRLLRADLAHELQELAPQTGQSLAGEIVSIAINADSIATWAMTALDELVRSGLPLEVVVDDQDFTQELLRSGQVMGCVTTLSQALRGCTMQPLGAMRYVAVASTDFANEKLPQGLTRLRPDGVPYQPRSPTMPPRRATSAVISGARWSGPSPRRRTPWASSSRPASSTSAIWSRR